MKKIILISLLIIPITSYALSIDDSFVNFTKFKSEKFYYPIITINGEIGSRYAFNPFDDISSEDYETIDAYAFQSGYIKLMQQLTKTSKISAYYMYRKKDYETEDNLDNYTSTLGFSTLHNLIPDVSVNLGINYKESNFLSENEKDGTQISPETEIKFRPKKEILLGLKYVYLNMKYNDESRNSSGNRILIYWQERFYQSKLKLRVRYRGENRNYDFPTSQRKSSTKHSVSATAIIDFN